MAKSTRRSTNPALPMTGFKKGKGGAVDGVCNGFANRLLFTKGLGHRTDFFLPKTVLKR